MSAYYNEIDPYAAQWLRNLIAAGHLPAGVVDERSIQDVQPDDLRPYTQCHFFAGIGGWPHALRLAGWPDDRPVWTGSCPCQPFSQAGAGGGFDDERHLWPDWYWLVGLCRPAVIFGEQVASKAVEPWVNLVHADMEALGYAFGAVPFPAAGVGAPHIRDRLYWVADANGSISKQGGSVVRGRPSGSAAQPWTGLGGDCVPDGLADAESSGRASRDAGRKSASNNETPSERQTDFDARICSIQPQELPGPVNSLWADADWLFCRDGKWRPVEPGTFPLANGVSNRVGRLRAYGNAIVPQAAEQFIRAYLS